MPEINVGDRFISKKQKFEVESYDDSTISIWVGLGRGRRSTISLPWRAFAAYLADGELKRLEKKS